MNIFMEWPQEIQNYVIDTYKFPTSIIKLDGIKQNGGCYRIQIDDSSIIIKEMTDPQEYLFYTKCLSIMESFNNNIPILYGAYEQDNNYWIIIEDVPGVFPKSRWNADSQQVDAMFRLHSESWGRSLPIIGGYTPKWDDQLTEKVLGLLSDRISNQIWSLLSELQKASQQLFKPYCWINADTNPTNWGIRKDGSIVLFDWERISCGSPAIDLAITIPGLETSDNSTEKVIVERYLSLWTNSPLDFPLNKQLLFEQLKLAKIWSAIEFLGSDSAAVESKMLSKISNQLIEKIHEFFR